MSCKIITQVVKLITLIVIININLIAQENKAKTLCYNEIIKEVFDRAILQEQCSKAAEFYDKNKKYGRASWYYLLSGAYKKNINEIEKKIQPNANLYSIAHSYVLANNLEKARELYRKSAQYAACNPTKKQYEILLKVYPAKQKELENGLRIWMNDFEPLCISTKKLLEKLDSVKSSQKKITISLEIIAEYKKRKVLPPRIMKYMLANEFYEARQYNESIEILKTIENKNKNILVLFTKNYMRLKKYKKSNYIYKKILLNSSKSNKDYFDYYHNIAENFVHEKNYHEAIKSYKNALKYLKIKDFRYAYTNIAIGDLYKKEKKFKLSLQFYNFAKNVDDYVGTSCEKISYLYIDSKQIDKISNCFLLEKERIKKNKKALEDLIFYLSTIGILYIFEEPNSKIKFIEQIILLKETFNINKNLEADYNALASCYEKLQQDEKALEYYQKAKAILEKKYGFRHDYILTLYNNIGYIYLKLKKYTLAKYYLLKAMKTNNKQFLYSVYSNMCSLYLSMGQNDKAATYYNLAVEIDRKYNTEDKKNHILISEMAGVFYNTVNYKSKSIKYFKEAYKISKKQYGENSLAVLEILKELSLALKSGTDIVQTYKYTKQTMRVFMKNINNIFIGMHKNQKIVFLRSNQGVVEQFLQISYNYKKDREDNKKIIQKISKEALNGWLNYKGIIFDSENVIMMLQNSTKDKTLKTKIEELLRAQKKLAKLDQSTSKKSIYQSREAKIKSLNAKIYKLNSEIASKATLFQEQLGLKNISYKDIAKYLKESELYVDYAKVGEDYYVFTVDSKENVTFEKIDTKNAKEIDSLVKLFRKDIEVLSNGNKPNKNVSITLQKLYNLALYQPISNIVKDKKSLIVSPGGALRLLPFEAMIDNEGKYLIENKTISYIFSGKEFVRVHKYAKYKKSKPAIDLFANPKFNTTIHSNNTSIRGILARSLCSMNFTSLPETAKEAKNIKAITQGYMETKVYLQKDATESNLLSIKSPKILHIATHGFFINNSEVLNPMLKSGIALSGANYSLVKQKSDGVVTALKLMGLNLDGTDLVVLSACETGVVDINSTDTVSALGKAFIQAGAKDVVLSLWKVDDKQTAGLMSSFYKEQATNKEYKNALREAKLKMIKDGLHPYYWGAFLINGL